MPLFASYDPLRDCIIHKKDIRHVPPSFEAVVARAFGYFLRSVVCCIFTPCNIGTKRDLLASRIAEGVSTAMQRELCFFIILCHSALAKQHISEESEWHGSKDVQHKHFSSPFAPFIPFQLALNADPGCMHHIVRRMPKSLFCAKMCRFSPQFTAKKAFYSK
jgi:hypothetical protein